MAQPKFMGFDSAVFDSCNGTKRGAHRICLALKNLRNEIEPKIEAKIDKSLVGKVSSPWSEGKYYRKGAWLMFTNRKIGAYKHPQLTINLFEDELWVGFRSTGDYDFASRYPFKIGSYARKHPKLFKKYIDDLSEIKWGFESDEKLDNFTIPRHFTPKELEARLLKEFGWINARFDKKDPLVRDRGVIDAIFDVLRRLYPLYAITVGKDAQIEKLFPEKEPGTIETIDLRMSRQEVVKKVREVKNVFKKDGGKGFDLTGIYLPAKEIGAPIQTSRKTVIRDYVVPVDELDLRPVRKDGEPLLVTPGMKIPSIKRIRMFKALLRKIVGIMGGNPETVKIMVKEPTSEARTIENQIAFNATLLDRSPIFWIIIAARELASLKYKEHYPHVKAMSILLEKAIKRLDEIDPSFKRK